MTMAEREKTSFFRDLMWDFAERTGLIGEQPATRYLWTDAFAVCNFLELEQRTSDATYRRLALRLVDQVHHVLGRHRADAPREGWISGLGDDPTKGGLRIGACSPRSIRAQATLSTSPCQGGSAAASCIEMADASKRT